MQNTMVDDHREQNRFREKMQKGKGKIESKRERDLIFIFCNNPPKEITPSPLLAKYLPIIFFSMIKIERALA